MSKPQFPKEIYVTREEPAEDEPYFAVQESGPEAVDFDGTPIALYRLVEVGDVQVTRSFRRKPRTKGPHGR